jgi:hypothetical protein
VLHRPSLACCSEADAPRRRHLKILHASQLPRSLDDTVSELDVGRFHLPYDVEHEPWPERAKIRSTRVYGSGEHGSICGHCSSRGTKAAATVRYAPPFTSRCRRFVSSLSRGGAWLVSSSSLARYLTRSDRGLLMMRPLIWTLLAAALAVADERIVFSFECPPVTIERLDPIVTPGAVSGHTHFVCGSSAFGPTATSASLRDGLCTSSSVGMCALPWVPRPLLEPSAAGDNSNCVSCFLCCHDRFAEHCPDWHPSVAGATWSPALKGLAGSCSLRGRMAHTRPSRVVAWRTSVLSGLRYLADTPAASTSALASRTHRDPG